MRHCVQSANKVLIKSGFLAGIEDRGQLSCHKVVVKNEKLDIYVLCFSELMIQIHIMYFDATDCFRDIERLIRIDATGGAVVGSGGPGLQVGGKTITREEVY